MNSDCVFCKIVDGEIPSEKLKETENLIVIKDINPQASTHLLLIPKEHVRDIMDLSESAWGEIRKVAIDLIKENGLRGSRIAVNVGDAAVVPHMHVHLLGEVGADRKL